MQISKQDEAALRERLSKTDGGIKATCALGGITERVAYKMFAFENIKQETYDAFCTGLEELERHEANRRQANTLRARTPAAQLA